MKVRYTLRARADFEAIYEYLEKQQHAAAQRLKSATRTKFITKRPGRRCASSIFGTPGEGRGVANVKVAGFSSEHYRGSRLVPIRNSSTARAHWRPSRIAQTTSDWPRRISPAANILEIEVR